jgi:hypothetical protein
MGNRPSLLPAISSRTARPRQKYARKAGNFYATTHVESIESYVVRRGQVLRAAMLAACLLNHSLGGLLFRNFSPFLSCFGKSDRNGLLPAFNFSALATLA